MRLKTTKEASIGKFALAASDPEESVFSRREHGRLLYISSHNDTNISSIIVSYDTNRLELPSSRRHNASKSYVALKA